MVLHLLSCSVSSRSIITIGIILNTCVAKMVLNYSCVLRLYSCAIIPVRSD